MSNHYAGVHVLDTPFSVDKEYEYAVPEIFSDNLQIGMFVKVPFGKGNINHLGLVSALSDTSAYASPKPIKEVLGEEIKLSEEMFSLCFFMKEQTLCSIGDAAHAITPFLTNASKELPFTLSFAHVKDGATMQEALDNKHIKGEKQRLVAEAFLRLNGQATLEEIQKECGFIPNAQLHALVAKGWLLETRIVKDTFKTIARPSAKTEIELNEEQKEAYSSLCELNRDDTPHGVLLYGITGSGKTSVMIKYIEYLMSLGKTAIVLLPEIALTPQSVAIFSSYFGDVCAVLHSNLTPLERRQTYNAAKQGKIRLIIGTRSAVFAPLPNLGAIIIDEEQEHTYKSDSNPKYHAKDVARFRCNYHKAVMLLCSATPSVESYYKASTGIYKLLTLSHRYGNAVLPTVEIADMRKEAQMGNLSPIGTHLAERLLENRKAKEQAILFLNRRGYHHYLYCPTCGESVRCPSCSVTMTYHTNKGTYDRGRMLCHICGKNLPVPTTCSSCGGNHLQRMGYGTQRLEQELTTLLPEANILRMDADSTVAKTAISNILQSFRVEGDILLGTQMVTKGHDFPGVSLVGVLDADASLYLDDYHAGERTFAMLTQVIGRAGRGNIPGSAVIQTNNPDSDIIRLAAAQNYPEFYKREIALRKHLKFPPFCDIALFTLSSSEEHYLLEDANVFASQIKNDTKPQGPYQDVPIQLFGPFEAPVYRVENKYRLRLVLKCRLTKRTRTFLWHLMQDCIFKKATLSIDINPTSL